jgi:transglutaminase-like putative cysteine protease
VAGWLDGRRIPRARWERELEQLVRRSVLDSTDVRYRREPRGRERWQTAAETYRLGQGDCEDLAVYLAADLRHRGINARVVIKRVNPRLRHALVLARVGERIALIDPSKKRGMKGSG